MRRRHLDAKRLMLQVALMRRYEQCGSWLEALAEPAITIDDDDIDTVLFIAYWSLQQTIRSPRRCWRDCPRSSPEPMRCVSVENLEWLCAPSGATLLYGRKPM